MSTVIEGAIGIVVFGAGWLMLLRPALADRFYDMGNRKTAERLARWGWKSQLRNYEKNRAASRRVIPIALVVIGAGFLYAAARLLAG
jgi:hypothetical protein